MGAVKIALKNIPVVGGGGEEVEWIFDVRLMR